jgi:hypothetical protein
MCRGTQRPASCTACAEPIGYRLDADNDGRPASWRVVATTRGILYTLARLMGDVDAVKKGIVGNRIGRGFVGKMMGRGIRRLFR